MVGKDPFRLDNRSSNLGKDKREKMTHIGDWWYAHSYFVWVFFGVIWTGITISVTINNSPKLAWVSGMVAFLHLYRGWEIYKNHDIIARIKEEQQNKEKDNK